MYKAEEYGSTVSNYDEEIIESIHSARDPAINIYPNPLNSTAVLEFPNPDNQCYSLIITDLAGKVVRTVGKITGSQVEIHRDNLPPGTYIIELRGPEIYRTKEEEESYRSRDCIQRFHQAVLQESLLGQHELAAVDGQVNDTMQAAIRFAQQSPQPASAEILSDVYVDYPESQMRPF